MCSINTKHQCISATMEPGKNCLKTASTQASNGLVFGIVLGSDLQADTQDFKSFGNSTAQGKGKPFGKSDERTSYLFGQTSAIGEIKIPCGTAVSFRPASGEDTMVTNGVTITIHTKLQCITAMKEYENKSLEELRIEDYCENRRSKQRGKSVCVSLHFQHSDIFFGSLTGQTSGVLFGTSAARTSCLFGQTLATNAVRVSWIPVGTTVSFHPPSGEDTMMKSGVSTSIHTKHQCITAMKEYENKSLDELRMADYSENRKSKQRGIVYVCDYISNTDVFFGTSTGQTSSLLFGRSTARASCLFGQTFATNATGFSGKPVGTTVSFHPPSGEDTMMKSGVTTNIHTKHQCITAMKEYENKSLEELRMEDYNENRRSKERGLVSGCVFGSDISVRDRQYIKPQRKW